MKMNSSANPVRLKDIAEMLQVSVSTVSMALSGHRDVGEQTAQRIRACATELGYSAPERRRVTPKPGKRRVGFWMFGSAIHHDSFACLTLSLSKLAPASGIQMEVSSYPDMVEAQKQFAALREFDGLLVSGVLGYEDIAALAAALKGDVCLLGRWQNPDIQHKPLPIPMIHWQEEAIAAAAVSHLFRQGHRNIGCICEVLYPGMSQDRFHNGYHQALRSAAIEPLPCYLHAQNAGGTGATHMIWGDHEMPTALIAPNARVMSLFLREYDPEGKQYPRDALIIWDSTEQADHYGLGNIMRITTSVADMAGAAFHVMQNPGVFRAGSSWALPFAMIPPS